MSEELSHYHPHTCKEKPEFRCHSCDEEHGFKRGVEANREIMFILKKEIDRLKEQNEKMREALIEVKLHECTCHTGCGPCFNYFYLIAEDVLKYIGENE